MTFYVDKEAELFEKDEADFLLDEIVGQVMQAVLEEEKCPYEAQMNLLLTDNEGIRHYNQEFRNIDNETDVLSFPGIPFRQEAGFEVAEEEVNSCFDPESGELMLGDIIISVEKVRSQAKEYGHSLKREFAFLLAHSLYHLCGYDHMLPEEAWRMEEKQEKILRKLGITRE